MIVNKKQLADIFGLSERTFTEYQRDPSFPYRAAGRGHDNEYDTTAVHSWLLERATTKGRESSREKLDRVRAGREELAYAAELKELIPAEETISLIEEAIIASRNVMLHGNTSLKKRLDREYQIDLDIEILNDHSREVLTNLSEVGEKLASEAEESLEEMDAA
ncbi:terminase small subunit [Marinobacterium stanieri]|uniref:terminase small subunit n=1 Tax=Marinobacterium stanieri TaxID=49186 RepID=UPI000255A5EF|nr:terminase small subunit [Marinobacterium stanieri]